MSEERTQRRLAAILAADVAGYSRLVGADEEGTLARLKAHRRELVDPKIAEHRGRIVKTTGDGLLVEFASVVDALRCAVEVQRGMAERSAGVPTEQRIALRIGINVGDIVVEGGDLYGDGVNVAARLEGLAEPGGICVSGRVQEDARGKLDLVFEDMGEQRLKNIAWPVRVYRAQLDRKTPAPPAIPVIPDKPSIAVLPFVNMSGDPAQDYFVDGITENIITDLSRFRDFFVIASWTSFTYKNRLPKIQDVCRELGVLYILEGSIQRSGDRMRISAQLIEGITGRHLWAERYDRRVDDIFALQDEVTQMIVGTLATAYGGRLGKAWQKRADGVGGRKLEALDYFLRGNALLNRFNKEENKLARESFAKSVELDPNYGKPLAKMAWTHWADIFFGWVDNADRSWEEFRKFASMAVERDDAEAWGHWALAGYYMYKARQHDRAVAEIQRALELNPNDADVMTDYGLFLSYSGQAEEGLKWALKAMRLNPHFPEWYVSQLGSVYYDARRYADAVATLEGLGDSETVWSDLYLAASHARLGHDSEASAAIERALKIEPEATIEGWITPEKIPYKEQSYRDHFREGLHKAGLPE